ncbi:MAG: lipopolysaccharide biosynthesis protein [Oscillospiraceae bacterium]|nr:lipopolysaccharide biosynthesis protein [Oscillospiraceae bacterium]
MEHAKQPKIASALIWKLLERFGVQGTQFVLQIVLARILSPDHYGALSLMVIFTTLANVFIQTGFNTALIRAKDVTNEDYSSVFWVSLGIAGVLYGVIFCTAPWIAKLYKMPDIVAPLRVLALMLLPGAFNSVQLAKVSREMNFRKVFISNVAAILVAGGVGIALAALGAGLWALVAQTMLNVFVACVVMFFTVKWCPRLVCSLQRVKVLFAFGWKILVSGLINTLYQDIRSLVIGVKYDAGTLGYYNKGKSFPQFIINAISGTVQSVMLPAMAKEQDDSAKVKEITRNSITISAFILFPLMAGLAGVATPLVQLLLTDKWLPCVPYLQIYCFTLAFNPVHMCNLQAINAMGRSDIFLKLEIIKKSIGLISLAIAVFCFQSPIAIALTGAFTVLISCFINAYPNKSLIRYSYFEQMKDLIPSFVLAVVMLAAVLAVQLLPLGNVLTLVVQIAVGLVLYPLAAYLFRVRPMMLLLQFLKKK